METFFLILLLIFIILIKKTFFKKSKKIEFCDRLLKLQNSNKEKKK